MIAGKSFVFKKIVVSLQVKSHIQRRNDMKKCLVFLVLLTSLALQAQTDSVKTQKKVWPSFLNKEQMPDGSLYLPAPPAFDSQEFVGDVVSYHWGKSLRDTPRGKQARFEAGLDVPTIFSVFSEPMGLKLSEEAFPELTFLVTRIMTDGVTATRKVKAHYNRLRPFLYFNEGTLVPEDEASHHTPSYPSSHASSGWTVALVLSELCPERAELILKAGYEYGQSRVIAGYHYQSDVDAARLAASACVARLHADEAFQQQLSKVKKELQKQKK